MNTIIIQCHAVPWHIYNKRVFGAYNLVYSFREILPPLYSDPDTQEQTPISVDLLPR